MRLPLRLIGLVTTFLLASSEGAAQAGVALAPATRIRYTRSSSESPVAGLVIVQRGDSVWVRGLHGWSNDSFALHGLNSLEISRRQSSRALSGAVVGFVGGAVGGTLLRRVDVGCASCAAVRYAAISVGLVGSVIGAFVGSRFTVDHWEQVPLVLSAQGMP